MAERWEYQSIEMLEKKANGTLLDEEGAQGWQAYAVTRREEESPDDPERMIGFFTFHMKRRSG